MLDELLVEVAGGLERLGVGRGLADQFGDVVDDSQAHVIHHAARPDSGLQGDHPGPIDALDVAHTADEQVEPCDFPRSNGVASVAQHDELIRLCAAGNAEHAAAVAFDTFHSLPTTPK